MARDNYLDIIKGFAIWLMVLGHSNFSLEPFITIIYSFHMPVFFLISGYFFRKKGFKEQLYRDFKSLMQPYFLASIMAFSICWISPTIHPELYSGINGIVDIYKAALVGIFIMDDTVKSYSFMPSGALWFLVALFISRLLFSVFVNFIESKKYNNVFLFLICLFSICLFFVFREFYYFSLDSAFMALPFLCIGYTINKYNLFSFLCSKINLFYWLLCLVGFCSSAVFNGYVSMDGGLYGRSIVLFYINALFAFFLLWWFSKRYLYNCSIIAYFGKNSLVVLIFHSYIIRFLKIIYVYCGGDASSMPFYVSIGFSLCVMFACKPICYLVNNHIPFLLGRKKK